MSIIIIAFLKQYKESESNSLEAAAVFKDYCRKENTNPEVKTFGTYINKN